MQEKGFLFASTVLKGRVKVHQEMAAPGADLLLAKLKIRCYYTW